MPKIDRTDKLLLLLIGVVAIIWVICVNVFDTHAATIEPSEVSTEAIESSLDEILTRMDEQKTAFQTSLDAIETAVNESKEFVTAIHNLIENIPTIQTWMLAIITFQAALTVVMIFAVGWRR
jgi:hypothetical protein